jgi:nitric oxide dioxygenase
MMSILNSLARRCSKQPISFIHGARDTSVQAFGQHVRQQAKECENVSSVLFIKSPVAGQDVEGKHFDLPGRLSIKKLDNGASLHLQDPTTKYFVCGPDRFMADIWRGLKALGVGEERIKMVGAWSAQYLGTLLIGYL